MVRTKDIVNEACRLADLGIGVDQDGVYGTLVNNYGGTQ